MTKNHVPFVTPRSPWSVFVRFLIVSIAEKSPHHKALEGPFCAMLPDKPNRLYSRSQYHRERHISTRFFVSTINARCFRGRLILLVPTFQVTEIHRGRSGYEIKGHPYWMSLKWNKFIALYKFNRFYLTTHLKKFFNLSKQSDNQMNQSQAYLSSPPPHQGVHHMTSLRSSFIKTKQIVRKNSHEQLNK